MNCLKYIIRKVYIVGIPCITGLCYYWMAGGHDFEVFTIKAFPCFDEFRRCWIAWLFDCRICRFWSYQGTDFIFYVTHAILSLCANNFRGRGGHCWHSCCDGSRVQGGWKQSIFHEAHVQRRETSPAVRVANFSDQASRGLESVFSPTFVFLSELSLFFVLFPGCPFGVGGEVGAN